MNNDTNTMQKAKKILKKYKSCCYILGVALLLILGLITFTKNVAVIFLTLAVEIFIFIVFSTIIFRKYITSIINDKLDPDTYLTVIYQGKLADSSAIWQLYGEYFCGNYENVIGICKAKIKDKKVPKRYKYNYLTYLANVYFDTGDDENLRQIYEQYKNLLEAEKPKMRDKYRKSFPRMAFYGMYLTSDIEACIKWINTPTALLVNQHHRTFCKARLALIQGNTDEARQYYEHLANTVPQINYGKLSAQYLEKTEYKEYAQRIVDLHETKEADVTLYPSGLNKATKALLIICATVFLVFTTVNALKPEESKQELESLIDQVDEAVILLDTLTLSDEEKITDAMIIGQTNTDIVIYRIYERKGLLTMSSKRRVNVSKESLSDDSSPIWDYSFPSTMKSKPINCYFYRNEADIPDDYIQLSTLELNGQILYFVVTEAVQ